MAQSKNYIRETVIMKKEKISDREGEVIAGGILTGKIGRNKRIGSKGREGLPSLSKLFGSVWAKRLISAVLCFTLALLIGGAEAFPGTYPFGIALVSAVSGLTATVSAMTGALLGSIRINTVGGTYALMLAVLTIARIVLSAWLASDKLPQHLRDRVQRRRFGSRLIRQLQRRPRDAANTLLQLAGNSGGIMLRENIKVRLALSACAALFAGAWSVVEGGYVYYDLFGAVFSLLTTPIITYLLYASLERNMRASRWREVGVYFTCAVVTLSLRGMLGTFPLELGIMFAFSVACIFSAEYGTHRGAVVGLACGMVMEPIYVPLYALGGVVCGSIAPTSFTFGILSAGAVAIAWGIYASGLDGLLHVFPPVVMACAAVIPLYKTGYLHLPPTLFGGKIAGRLERTSAATMAEVTLDETKAKIGSLSEGLTSVSAVLQGMSERLAKPSRSEMRELCEDTFERYCRACRMAGKCRGGGMDGHGTSSVIGKMTESLAESGAVSAEVIPSSLASSCPSMGRILDDINYEAAKRVAEKKRDDKLSVSAMNYGLAGEVLRQAGRAAMERAERDEELTKKLARLLTYHDFRAASAAAYGVRRKQIFVGDIDLSSTRMGGEEIQKLFEEMCGCKLSSPEFELDGAELSMRMHSVDAFRCTSGMFSCAASSVHKYCGGIRGCGANCAEGELDTASEAAQVSVTDTVPADICGDAITAFEHDGMYYMILSDGMGSGREAALTSGICVSLLERLIRAGTELDTALKMLNQIIRQSGRECSATVDIAQIDLISGEARFIKSGAAPTFILRDGSIFRLQSKTVPIGIIRVLDAEMLCFEVRAGDTVVMISDGAARSYEEAPWLLDLMTVDETVLRGGARPAAEKIVTEAALRAPHTPDDITAGIVRVGKV